MDGQCRFHYSGLDSHIFDLAMAPSARGRVMVMVVPWPSTLATVI
jgi:hypothetical protein